MNKYPELNAIYLAAGGVAGAGRALEETGSSRRIHVICNDLMETEKDLLARGVISALIGQQPYEQGYKPIQYLFEYLLDGTLPPAQTITNSEIIIREHFINRESDRKDMRS